MWTLLVSDQLKYVIFTFSNIFGIELISLHCIWFRRCLKFALLIFRVIFYYCFFQRFLFLFHTCVKEFACTSCQLFKFSLHETWFSYHKNIFTRICYSFAGLQWPVWNFNRSVSALHSIYSRCVFKKHNFVEKFRSLSLLEINAIKWTLSMLFFIISRPRIKKNKKQMCFCIHLNTCLSEIRKALALLQLQLKLLKHEKDKKTTIANKHVLFIRESRRAPTNNGQPLQRWPVIIILFHIGSWCAAVAQFIFT